jgi:hypothetical protein
MDKMKLPGLRIVTNEQTTQTSATIADALPPPIHAVTGEPVPARTVRHLNVDEVLARSLPKLSEGFEKAA